MGIIDFLNGIYNVIISIPSLVVALLSLIISGLRLGLLIVLTIVPIALRLFPLFAELIPQTLIPFVYMSLAIFLFKFIISHGKGKGGPSGSSPDYEKKGEKE